MVRSIYTIDDPELGAEFVAQLGVDLQDESCPPEIQRLGRTITKWRHQIAAWHQARHTNGPTEAVYNLIKRIKRVAFGITNWTNYRTRALLYAGKPDWTSMLSPRRRIDQALHAVIMQAYVEGVSTRSVDDLVQATQRSCRVQSKPSARLSCQVCRNGGTEEASLAAFVVHVCEPAGGLDDRFVTAVRRGHHAGEDTGKPVDVVLAVGRNGRSCTVETFAPIGFELPQTDADELQDFACVVLVGTPPDRIVGTHVPTEAEVVGHRWRIGDVGFRRNDLDAVLHEQTKPAALRRPDAHHDRAGRSNGAVDCGEPVEHRCAVVPSVVGQVRPLRLGRDDASELPDFGCQRRGQLLRQHLSPPKIIER